jgi:signal transduction histidine kinase
MAILSGPLMLTVSGPIARLREGVRSVERGDFDVAVPVTSSDELGELTGRFNEMAASLRRSSSELRASRARIVAAADESRRKVERDLHDGAQQSLVLLNLKLGLLEKRLASDPEAHSAANEIRAELDQALAELRDLAHGIYPQVLTSDGLSAALNHAAAGCAIPASLDSSGTGRYQPEVEAAVYFCCLEALQNAAKYAGDSASARIELTQADDELRFAVSDDGAGFDPLSANGSAGLQNMADRIGALGGELRVESGPGEGTRVVGRVPARNVGLG